MPSGVSVVIVVVVVVVVLMVVGVVLVRTMMVVVVVVFRVVGVVVVVLVVVESERWAVVVRFLVSGGDLCDVVDWVVVGRRGCSWLLLGVGALLPCLHQCCSCL